MHTATAQRPRQQQRQGSPLQRLLRGRIRHELCVQRKQASRLRQLAGVQRRKGGVVQADLGALCGEGTVGSSPTNGRRVQG